MSFKEMESIVAVINIGIPPHLFKFGGLMVTWHSLITVLSVGLAVFLIDRWAKRDGLHPDIVPAVAWWAIPGGIIGARLLFVVDHWGFYSAHPGEILAVWRGGIAVYGAIFGGLLAGAAFALFKRYPVRQIMDLSAPGLILAQGVGRIGDLINGEHFSTATTLPWAVVYTHHESPGHGLPPTHPAVGYEMLLDFAAFGVLWMLRGRIVPNGSLFAVYAALYAVIRFSLSFLRLDSSSAALGLNQQAWASLAVFLAAVGFLVWLRPTVVRAELAPEGTRQLTPRLQKTQPAPSNDQRGQR